MEGYYFLFFAALVFLFIGTFFDLKKKREVPNWIPFSLIVISLSYRALYAVYSRSMGFFLFGIAGFVIFYLIGSIFYYSRAFGGADVKLLSAVGIILPYTSYGDLFMVSLLYILLLFFIGSIYSMLYSIAISIKNNIKFKIEFQRLFLEHRKMFSITSLMGIVLILPLWYIFKNILAGFSIAILFILFSLLYIYLKAVDRCMIVEIDAGELTEGDWIDYDIRVGRRIIRKSVHGLSAADIALLKKAKKNVEVHQGIPFVPVIFISVIFMVFFYLTLGPYLLSFLHF